VFFSDGSWEEVRSGLFTHTDRNGQVRERRPARGSDLARLRAYFGGHQPQTATDPPKINSRAVKAIYRGRNIEILYANGWRELIEFGRFRLVDQYGRVVASRSATQADRTRLNRFRK
jgi:hypothetical protein